MMKFLKKYTSADLYRDGLFQKEVAMQAMKEMLEVYQSKGGAIRKCKSKSFDQTSLVSCH